MATKIKTVNDLLPGDPFALNDNHISSYVSFDTETTGLDPYRGARIFAWSTCSESGDVVISRYDTDKKSHEKVQQLLYDTSVAKICHNLHFDLAMLQIDGYNIPSDTVWHDSMLICQVLNNLEPSNSLDELAYKYGGYPMDQDNPIKDAAKIYGSYDKIPRHLMEQYQHADAERTMLLFKTFYPIIKRDPDAYMEYLVELALVHTTIAFERRGMMLCKPEALKLQSWLKDELEQVQKDIVSLIKYPINLNSPKQVVHLLYEELGWPVLSMNKSGLAPATDKDALEALRAASVEYNMPQRAIDILDVILRQRSYTKGMGMILSYLEAADHNDIICPHLNTNSARTSRESSENPNMQNVQKEVSLKTRFAVPARKCFRARPGYVLFLKDYAGVEMRLAIQATGSARLLKMAAEGFDFHDACAKLFYGTKYTDPGTGVQFYLTGDHKRQKTYRDLVAKKGRDEALKQTFKIVKKMLRSAAKNGRFAMLYGAGVQQVAYTLGLSLEETKAGYARDKEEFPELYTMMDDCITQANSQGYIETFFGRKLRINPRKAYTATDYKIQGSAAGLFKRAQVRVSNYLKQKWDGYDISIWMVVHDELIIEMPRVLMPYCDEILSDIDLLMTSFPEITVKLSIETKKSAYVWAGAEEYKLAA
jgi:DNA polymerase I